MGRPIKPAYVGNPADYTDGRSVIVFNSAWINGASAISTLPVYIIKQTGATRYLVSDSITTGEVYLVDTITGQGQGIINVVSSNPSSVFTASKILLHRVDTFQDSSLAWTFGGENAINSMTADQYNSSVNSAMAPGIASVSINNATSSSIDIAITAPSTGNNAGIQYQIYTGTSSTSLTLNKTVTTTGTTTISGLSADTTYYIRVDSINSSNIVSTGAISSAATLSE